MRSSFASCRSCRAVAARRSRVGWEGAVWGQPRVGARKLTATRSRNLPKAVSRAGQPKPSARAVSIGSAMRRLALETCGPLSAAGEFIRALPQGEGGQPENVGFDTRASDAPRRVSGFCGWGVGASRAFRSLVARERISGAGEARVSGLGLAGDCASRLEKIPLSKIFFHRFFLITSRRRCLCQTNLRFTSGRPTRERDATSRRRGSSREET